MRETDLYISRKTSLGAVEPTFINPFLTKNFLISEIGVCLICCVFLRVCVRIERLLINTPILG